ncbi:Uncharacterised protein [uncultured Clostridium sp.]|nr:Uncharacterised protein [uncultured Clostridium sp.]SCI80917.1 Uncharacterised protein [uncultured Clostridium sp.]
MEENKTTRVNRTVNYYSDRPDYDRHMEKHNCHCERPHYDHCPEKPEYDHYQERPHYDHCPERPEYDHHPVRPNHDHYPSKPEYDHHPVRPNYDHYPSKPEYDHHPVRPNYDHYPSKPDYDHPPVRPNHDCHDEKPKHECCEDKPNCDFCSERPKPGCCCPDLNLKPNGCTKCCDPIKVKCPDIHCAVCTPILADRICAFACTDQSITSLFDGLLFTIDNPPMVGFPEGASVCIEKIAVQYTCAGFTNAALPITICSFTGTIGNRGPLGCSTTATPLFNSYEGSITPRFLCHDNGTKATFGHTALNASINGIQYIVQGFIGCTPFTARTDILVPRLYADINLFGNICLSNINNELTLRANFDIDLLVKQIIPSTDGILAGGLTFEAQVLDVLRINERLFALTPDELVVYSSPDGFSLN